MQSAIGSMLGTAHEFHLTANGIPALAMKAVLAL